ncbi:MAG: polyprenyl diphosphate synthase [Candidatus Sericytochromatia bacterium]
MFAGLGYKKNIDNKKILPEEIVEFAKNSGVDLTNLPKHIAFIMDGNGRWAKAKGEKRTFGHKSGVKVVKDLVKIFRYLDIPFITVYAFSSENWKRTPQEVDFLMNLFEESILKECEDLKRNGVRIRFIGRKNELRPNLVNKMEWIEKETASQNKLFFNVAINYGGRNEILDAVKNISNDVLNKKISLDEINNIDEKLFEKYLYTTDMPDPDLIIRTSGEMRISNYLLWQIAYSEIWVTETRWPEFGSRELVHALYDFQNRERRFGKE